MLHATFHRSRLILLVLCWCVIGQRLHGQEAQLPRPATQDPAPLEPTPTPAATLPPAAPELIPADILPPPDPTAPAPLSDIPTIEQLDEGLKPAPLSPAAESHRQHLEWRRLRNQVQNEPAVKAALRKAEAARTDLEKRRLLARYYDLFYRRMAALAPADMKTYLNDRKRAQLAALPQPRVRPETALATPSPAASSPPVAGASPSPTGTPSADTYSKPSESPSKRGGFGLPRP